MTWFDVGALAVVALAAADGAWSGLAWSALETALLVLVALLARGLREGVEPYLRKVAELGPDDLSGAAHAVVFAVGAGVAIGALVLLHPASKRWRFAHDRWWGGFWGAVNGALASLLLFAMVLWPAPRQSCEQEVRESQLVPVLAAVHGTGLSGLFPGWTAARLAQVRSP
jgi:hypothetical protein